MSEISRLPGLDALQSPNMTQWSAKLDAAQSERADMEVKQAAASVEKIGAQTAGTKSIDPKEAAKLKAVSQDFESLFLSYMFKTMKSTVPENSFMGQSQGEQIFSEMKDDELAKGMAKAGGIGLSKLLEEQLLRSLQAPSLGAARDAVSLKKGLS